MKHIVVTKFNLPDGTGRHMKLDWLEDRFDLFEKWAIPSLKAQTVQDFTWLVYCWEDTPKTLKARMKDYNKKYPNLQPQFINGDNWPTTWENWMSCLQNYAAPGSVFTTRIDSDDAIRKDYLERVRGFSSPGIWTCFNYGYMYRDGKVYLRKYDMNPFLTYLETVKDVNQLETVNKHTHPQAYPMAYLETEDPGWVQNVHENTGWNKFTVREGDMLTDWLPFDDVREDFGL